MLGMLLAYDDDGRVIATLDYMVRSDDAGDPLGLVDFDAHELAGGQLTDVWKVEGAAGSGAWPEWLGSAAHAFRVERDESQRPHRITALVHVGLPASRDQRGREIPEVPGSGLRRERSEVEAAISERIEQAAGKPADIRDLVGGPDRPLLVDESGRTKSRGPVTRPALPIAGKIRVLDTSPTTTGDRRAADSLRPAGTPPRSSP